MEHPRFYFGEPLTAGQLLELPDTISRHFKALRLQPGDHITLFNGEGGEFSAELVSLERRHNQVKILAHHATERESDLSIHLGLAVIRRDAMDFAIQKATELGVSSITPIVSRFSNEPLNRAAARVGHWQRVVYAACEQCGRNRPAIINNAINLADWLAQVEQDKGIHLLLDPRADEGFTSLEKPPEMVVLMVGPEGGFADEEVKAAVAAGFMDIRFGQRVMRAETAPIAALAVIQHLWGDLA